MDNKLLLAESSVLSAMMIGDEPTATAIDLIDNFNWFSKREHRIIFSTLSKMFEERVRIDTVSLIYRLRDDNTIAEIGGELYINHLSNYVLSPTGISQHIQLIRREWLAREVILISKDIIRKVNSKKPIDTVLNTAREKLLNIDNSKDKHEYSSGDAVKQALKQTEDNITSGKPVGLKTYIHDLDNFIIMKPGNLITIGGNSGSGKTMLANQIAFRNVLEDKRICFFNMEMEVIEIINREISRQSRIDLADINHGRIKDDIEKYNYHASVLSDNIFNIDDNGIQTISKIHSRLIKYRNKMGGLDLVVIDYFQLIGGGVGETRQQQLGQISRSLKALAKHFQVPIIILSQLNADGKTRESKDLFQDSDIVALLFRPAFDGYQTHLRQGVNKIKRDGEWIVPEPHFSIVDIAKNRGGRTGSIRISFDGAHQQFNGWEDNWEEEI